MKKARKGFTLVELLIVIAVIGVLASAMSMSGGSATALAKASTIYSNIRNIKTAGLLYQVQEGDTFDESKVTAENLKTSKLLDLDTYNKKGEDNSNIQYKIVAGVLYDGAVDEGAYVICQFIREGDRADIVKALKGYKDIRINGDGSSAEYTVGAFFYHPTEAKKGTETYDTDFEFSSN